MTHQITLEADAFGADADRLDSELFMLDLLEGLVRHNVRWLARHPKTPRLYASGVRYEPEPIGRELWQDIATTLKLGCGDCEDLACWLAAELRQRDGIAATVVFVCRKLESGARLYHILVRLPDGRILDPSKRLGMGKKPLPAGYALARNQRA